MEVEDGRRAAIRLAGRAHEVGYASGRTIWREVLQRISGGRLGRRRAWSTAPQLNAPWQDTVSPERAGWRQRAANLNGEYAFAVDYLICSNCKLAWVEQPFTLPHYQRCGLASAGLAALRAEHPGLAWHTLGGHFRDSLAFWTTVATDVPGGYQQRRVCSHFG